VKLVNLIYKASGCHLNLRRAACANTKRCAKVLLACIMGMTGDVENSHSEALLIEASLVVTARINRQEQYIDRKKEPESFQ